MINAYTAIREDIKARAGDLATLRAPLEPDASSLHRVALPVSRGRFTTAARGPPLPTCCCRLSPLIHDRAAKVVYGEASSTTLLPHLLRAGEHSESEQRPQCEARWQEQLGVNISAARWEEPRMVPFTP